MFDIIAHYFRLGLQTKPEHSVLCLSSENIKRIYFYKYFDNSFFRLIFNEILMQPLITKNRCLIQNNAKVKMRDYAAQTILIPTLCNEREVLTSEN